VHHAGNMGQARSRRTLSSPATGRFPVQAARPVFPGLHPCPAGTQFRSHGQPFDKLWKCETVYGTGGPVHGPFQIWNKAVVIWARNRSTRGCFRFRHSRKIPAQHQARSRPAKAGATLAPNRSKGSVDGHAVIRFVPQRGRAVCRIPGVGLAVVVDGVAQLFFVSNALPGAQAHAVQTVSSATEDGQPSVPRSADPRSPSSAPAAGQHDRRGSTDIGQPDGRGCSSAVITARRFACTGSASPLRRLGLGHLRSLWVYAVQQVASRYALSVPRPSFRHPRRSIEVFTPVGSCLA